MRMPALVLISVIPIALAGAAAAETRYFDVAGGSGPHDVAAAPGGPVYYTGQRNGTLGILDVASGKVEEVKLGARSAPHGVIVGPDGAPWVTAGGLNAVLRVDPEEWRAEIPAVTEWFDKFGDKLPGVLWAELDALKARLGIAVE